MHTVLLIEDQPDVALMLRLAISRSGHRALLAMNIKEAEQIWAAYRNEITVIVADDILPDGSGVQLARRLREECTHLRVIMTSGLARTLPPEFQRLDKPFSISEFKAVLGSV
jgi:DNA-binding response OmpR family regulator